MSKRLFSSLRALKQHDNPLGLPRSGTAPRIPRRGELRAKRPIQNVHKVIAIASAKGGVGKSTLAANLAVSFARQGYRSGILDADIFGPSIPTLFGLSDASEPFLSANNRLTPLVNYGVKTMSMGYLVKEEHAIVWRGLMVAKAIEQLLHEVDWGGLDILVLDLPPGTGDVQLSIAQQIELDGAVIVSTPQDLALKDALKGLAMFRKVSVPVLGMVQNMSAFVCPHCGTTSHVFGADGVQRECRKHMLDFLGDVPLHLDICKESDSGKPTVVAAPTSKRAQAFSAIASELEEILHLRNIGQPAYTTDSP